MPIPLNVAAKEQAIRWLMTEGFVWFAAVGWVVA